MKNLLILLFSSIVLTGCSYEFWEALDSVPAYSRTCTYFNPIDNTVRYRTCSSYSTYREYYYYTPTYPSSYAYRYTPSIIIINNTKENNKSTYKGKQTNKNTDVRRSTGVNRENLKTQNRSTPSARNSGRGTLRSENN